MIKGIPSILSPDLMKVMMEMGHGDKLIIADGNFPSKSQGVQSLSFDGHGTIVLLESILKFFPLDTYIEKPIELMSVVKGDNTIPKIWENYYTIFESYGYDKSKIDFIERFKFYEKAKNSYIILATSEKALYANISLTKGVVE